MDGLDGTRDSEACVFPVTDILQLTWGMEEGPAAGSCPQWAKESGGPASSSEPGNHRPGLSLACPAHWKEPHELRQQVFSNPLAQADQIDRPRCSLFLELGFR